MTTRGATVAMRAARCRHSSHSGLSTGSGVAIPGSPKCASGIGSSATTTWEIPNAPAARRANRASSSGARADESTVKAVSVTAGTERQAAAASPVESTPPLIRIAAAGRRSRSRIASPAVSRMASRYSASVRRRSGGGSGKSHQRRGAAPRPSSSTTIRCPGGSRRTAANEVAPTSTTHPHRRKLTMLASSKSPATSGCERTAPSAVDATNPRAVSA